MTAAYAIGGLVALVFLLGGGLLYLLGRRHGESEADADFDRAWAAKMGEEPDGGDGPGAEDGTITLDDIDTAELPTATTKAGPVRVAVIVVGPQGEDS